MWGNWSELQQLWSQSGSVEDDATSSQPLQFVMMHTGEKGTEQLKQPTSRSTIIMRTVQPAQFCNLIKFSGTGSHVTDARACSVWMLYSRQVVCGLYRDNSLDLIVRISWKTQFARSVLYNSSRRWKKRQRHSKKRVEEIMVQGKSEQCWPRLVHQNWHGVILNELGHGGPRDRKFCIDTGLFIMS